MRIPLFSKSLNSSFVDEPIATSTLPPAIDSANSTSLVHEQSVAESSNNTVSAESIVVQDDQDSNNMNDILQELEDRMNKRNDDHEMVFKNKVISKLQRDIRSRKEKHSAARFLVESFDESLEDYSFVCWLAKKLDLKPCRLQDILKNYNKVFAPRNSLPCNANQTIHDFWLKEENSIVTNDRRNGRDVIRLPKSTYLMVVFLTQIFKRKRLS